METDDNINQLKIKIADVIIKMNDCERLMKIIIANFLKAKDEYFVKEVLLNNHLVNFSSKTKLILYIIEAKKIECDKKELKNALNTMMLKRNALAHSDSPLEDFILSSKIDEDGIRKFDIVETEPKAPIYQSDKFAYEEYEKIITDFDKYYEIAYNRLMGIHLYLP